MSYREILQKQIKELEDRINNQQSEKAVLEKQLSKLKLAEFEEELGESHNQQLLKG